MEIFLDSHDFHLRYPDPTSNNYTLNFIDSDEIEITGGNNEEFYFDIEFDVDNLYYKQHGSEDSEIIIKTKALGLDEGIHDLAIKPGRIQAGTASYSTKYPSPSSSSLNLLATYTPYAIKIVGGRINAKTTTNIYIKKVRIYSQEYWTMKNGLPALNMISDAPNTNIEKPYPNTVWQIDGFNNDGYPFINLIPGMIFEPLTIDVVPINFLDVVRVRSRPHNLDQDFVVTKMSIPLAEPENTKFTLGKNVSNSFTAATNSINTQIAEQIKSVPKASSLLKNAKSNASALINSATNGYVTMVQENGHTSEIVISDNPDYKSAQNVWRWNQGGLAHSGHGYDAEEYDAAITMDGSIVADRITVGTMTADHMRGGDLVLGGFDGKDGTLSVLKADENGEPKEVVRLDKDGAFINGELYGAEQNAHWNDQFSAYMKYFTRIRDSYVRFGVVDEKKGASGEEIYANLGITDIEGHDNKWHHTLTIDTNNIWIGENDIPGAEGNFKCESITVNGHTMASCKITVVEGIDVQTASIETKDGTSINVVTNVTTHEATYDFYRGFLYSDSGTPLGYD